MLPDARAFVTFAPDGTGRTGSCNLCAHLAACIQRLSCWSHSDEQMASTTTVLPVDGCKQHDTLAEHTESLAS